MEAIVLNRNFEQIYILDEFKSFVWTDRYYEAGDFQLYVAATSDILNYLQQDYYLYNCESEHLMIIEQIDIMTDPEEGDEIEVIGRSLESILDRRIVWGQQTFRGNFQSQMQRLLNLNAISPSIANRRIPNLVFSSTSDSYITGLTVDSQYTGDNVYNLLVDACTDQEIGWKVVLDSSNRFVFSFYNGTDRSYEQGVNPYVVFSPNYENIVNSKYLESRKNYKNIAYVGGEGEGTARTWATYDATSSSGLDRRELYVDARDLSSDIRDEQGNTTTLTPSQYQAVLKQRGADKLAENTELKMFEGEVETTQMYLYNRDFFMGDIVEIENEYGITACARVTEMVMSHDTSGEKKVPGFEIV